ncbi:hypothetical protein J4H92_12350 [Leucobacter weissii]|uniref:Uncharacterized protein n=1 Tax=Leucobacter weissii TaxID=1983706 RepID=A0A939MQG6_9MICO|nr:hypothetical protein [Leucobacter weissii]MBO1902736.1 hypothetical protein [Leucobacter weissii]
MVPRLAFRLPGTWWSLDLESPARVESSAKRVAAEVFGRADEHVAERRKMQAQLLEAATLAREGGAQAMMIQSELAPGTPLSTSLVTYEDDRLRMSPTVGTAASAVLGTLEKALETMDPEQFAVATRKENRHGDVLRTHAVVEGNQAEGGEVFTSRRIDAKYWCPVPGTKQLLLVVLSSPLGDIEHAMLSYFDAVISAAYFEAPGQDTPA